MPECAQQNAFRRIPNSVVYVIRVFGANNMVFHWDNGTSFMTQPSH